MRRNSGLGWSVSVAAYALLSACAGDADVTAPTLVAFGVHAHEVFREDVLVESSARGEVILRRAGQSLTASDARPIETLVAGTDVKLQFRNGVALHVREVGLEGSPRAAQGAVSEARDGGTSFWTLADHHGFEEWLELAPGVAFADRAVAEWEVDGALREVPETGGIHVLDASGSPRVYVSAPVAWLESGERVPATLRIENGRIALYVDARGEHVLVDPVWVPTNSMARGVTLNEGSNTAIVLPDGDVLVPAGTRAERYNQATAAWSDAGLLVAPRSQHTATRLSDGRVLVVGGTGSLPTARVVEIFNPLTNAWTAVAPISVERRLHSATLLTDGRVLVVGGGSPSVASSEIYDPPTNMWSAAAPIPGARIWHSATRLLDGRVLVAGGSNGSSALNSAYVYNPVTNSWTPAGSMRTARCRHTASLLPSGRVLIAAGFIGMVGAITAEIYDPATNAFTATGSLASSWRDYHTATTMPDGSVLVVGGSFAASIPTTERYDETRGTWVMGPMLTIARYDHVAASLPSGRVLVAGGYPGLSSSEVLIEDTCGNGILDLGETCDDGNRLANDCCVTCALSPLGRVCRPEAGTCDVAERCDGVSTTCPANVVLPATTVCRPSVSECDVAEVCSGFSGVCGPDEAQPVGSTCGTSPTDPCDLQDTCAETLGARAYCAARTAAWGTICRASVSPCDVAETCVGTATCPPNLSAANGTSCSDGTTCNGAESCLAGTCTSGTAPRCEDSDVCTTDLCAEPSGCTSVRIAGCCHFSSECPNLDGDPCTDPVCSDTNRCTEIARDCSDADTCTADSCIAGGGCAHTEIAGCRPQDAGFDAASVDASSRPLDVGLRDSGPSDAGARDAGIDAAAVRNDASMDSPPSASCGCRIPQPTRARSWLGLVTLGLLAVRTRRPRRPHPTAL